MKATEKIGAEGAGANKELKEFKELKELKGLKELKELKGGAEGSGAEGAEAESPEPAAEAKEATQATQGEAEAYKRGRNDAIREFMQKDTAKTPALEARNLTPGVPSTLQPPEDLFLARLFRLRPSVWEYGRN